MRWVLLVLVMCSACSVLIPTMVAATSEPPADAPPPVCDRMRVAIVQQAAATDPIARDRVLRAMPRCPPPETPSNGVATGAMLGIAIDLALGMSIATGLRGAAPYH